ncbi:protein HOTHEAD-like [Iris pallida]|uniref:Protein HOTHEAD-like n=1 Tax=Iris pallida TaxID=29817 RepID=A0AAX6F578_IRIPA|nr:protein HOTHEAD-like [Iris pallida]KAJ6811523.1 protein HOTHEAD-like [Iris pallida]KAJ6811524.1 protein HOTHEAD-like [Iris pallida]
MAKNPHPLLCLIFPPNNPSHGYINPLNQNPNPNFLIINLNHNLLLLSFLQVL